MRDLLTGFLGFIENGARSEFPNLRNFGGGVGGFAVKTKKSVLRQFTFIAAEWES